ncbi:hypothetical protein M407DRAFT_8371 [Tulasnella calospora MUT 4182]|uniref:Uncharacterized protein n=1 Tax=Tulasnella calospora MUT 4182 TaxID=1051891 RepID=A0A0C3Q7C7_9AGAM|nr:hypothetical protein M407DRAFT_8371 [Tulasnella calospora MUT 4182]
MIQKDATYQRTQIPSINAFLSLAQIHRALRPLRTKVLALSKSITAAGATSRTKQTSVSAFQERNPLTIVPHPSRFQFSSRSSSILSEWDPASHELDTGLSIIDFARKAHAISDAFRNVVTRAYGDELSQRTSAIPPLMEIVTAIIGDDIEASVIELLRANRPLNSDDSSFEVEDDDEEDETTVIDGCYEQIPEHLRRWALVPHAVKMILIRAPNSPTILETCLDIALEHRSTRDALCFLRRILSVAFTRRQSDDIPIKSSQHGDYLVHLLRKPNHPSKPITSAWSDIQFTEEVISAISRMDPGDQEELWCCVAVRALFSAVSDRTKLCLVTAFSTFCAASGGGRLGKRQLRTWVDQILCASVHATVPHTLESETGDSLEEVDMGVCLGDISICMGALVDAGPLSSLAEFFRDTFICIAVHSLLISHSDQGKRPELTRAVVSLLSPLASTTSPSSFNPLLSAISESFPGTLDAPRRVELALGHARPLQEEGLHRMRAALLAAALNALENEGDPTSLEGESANRSVCSLRTALAEAEAQCVQEEGNGAETKWRYDEDHGWVAATPAIVSRARPRESFPSLSKAIKRKRPLRIEDEEEEEEAEEDLHGPAKRLQVQTTPYLDRFNHHWGSSPDPMHLKTPGPGPRTALRRGIETKHRDSLGRLSSLSCQLAIAGEDEGDEEVETQDAGAAASIKGLSEQMLLHPVISSDDPAMDFERESSTTVPSSPYAAVPSPQTLKLAPLPALDLPPRRLLNLPPIPRAGGRGVASSGRHSLPPRLAQALRRMSSSGSLGLPKGKEP